MHSNMSALLETKVKVNFCGEGMDCEWIILKWG